MVADEVLTQAHPVSADGKRGASRREVVAPQEFAELLAKPIGFDRCLHAFQGRTVDNVIAAMEAGHPHLTTQKSFYVEISRARDRAEMVTDNAAKLKEHLEQATGERISALEGIEPERGKASEPGSELVPDLGRALIARLAWARCERFLASSDTTGHIGMD